MHYRSSTVTCRARDTEAGSSLRECATQAFEWHPESARTIIVAIAKAVENAKPVRFVHVGGASGEESIDLPGPALCPPAIQLMGSGAKSVAFPKLLDAISNVFQAVAPQASRSRQSGYLCQRLKRPGSCPENPAS